MYAGVVVGMFPMDNMALVEVGWVDKVNIDDTQDEEGRRFFSPCPSFSIYHPLFSFYFSSNFQSATFLFRLRSSWELLLCYYFPEYLQNVKHLFETCLSPKKGMNTHTFNRQELTRPVDTYK